MRVSLSFLCLSVAGPAAVLISTSIVVAADDNPYQSGQLTAADVDDNLNFAWYLKYQSRKMAQDSDYSYKEEEGGVLPKPFLRDRIPLQILDSTGSPFSCAEVQVQGKTLSAATNGKLSLFPTLDELGTGPWQVTVKTPGGSCPDDCVITDIADQKDGDETSPQQAGAANVVQGNETYRDTVQVSISDRTSSLPTAMDIALLMDTTGSMCDEIDYLKTELGEILTEAASAIDVRLAYIAYKSANDEPYDVNVSPFGSTPNFADKLATEECTGGANGELVNKALEAASQLEWRSGNVARLALIVGDEPPHGSPKQHMQEAFDAALDLRSSGVRVYGLAASGVEERAEYLFRLISFITGARYLWLTDDSGIGDPHAEPEVLCYQVTHLDKLLYRVIRSELTGTRVEADPSHIIREVGQQEAGVCLYDLNSDEPGDDGDQEHADGQPTADSGAPPTSSSGSSSSSSSSSNASRKFTHTLLMALLLLLHLFYCVAWQ